MRLFLAALIMEAAPCVRGAPFGIDWDRAYSPTSEPLMWNKVTYVRDGKPVASPGRTSIVPFCECPAARCG